ncbi:type II toxin-antitoxin system RelE/ParE family toxin [Roseiconus nitratireducens]|uniref:Type II toxin-antitoxin system RelE/ParE family toxin n=1 Tax=Roseiconus nitratireducens TaxID=2605748 RepID=A0A5M6CX82_9BACT|nr:type II toxin-antitoxin system RelE/ParE family toxin [Roseiconus nitratireducens]KAA5539000.1 type II toxin-antitoxin system RelE/ParE family toxin [Roseiconus nitratireducens]
MADLQPEFHEEANFEAIAAHDYYAEKSVHLGEAFQAELESAIGAIVSAPDTWATYLYGTRRYLMHRFPFVVVYRRTSDRLEIVAVAHGHQRPGYWRDRTG